MKYKMQSGKHDPQVSGRIGPLRGGAPKMLANELFRFGLANPLAYRAIFAYENLVRLRIRSLRP
jgi:hypothetical protein